MYEAMRQGVIPHVRLGKQYRIPKKRLLEWLEDPEKK
jgi:excisionase family DNA binding protein